VTKMTFVVSTALLVAGLSARSADAQVLTPRVGTPAPTPTVSPYINLARNPNAPTLNYFGLVRPQFQTNAGLEALQQQLILGQTGPLPGAEPTGDVLITGHAAVFMNYGGYFQSQTGAIRSAAIVPTPTPSRPSGPAAPSARLPRPGPR
jgi:hypothetical protein